MIFSAWILSAQLPFIASAIDLDSLESMFAQGCQGIGCNADCDADLAKRVNVDLPTDTDTCHAKRQYRLLEKGLYLSKDGKIYSLEKKFQPLASKKTIALEGLRQQAVEDKVSPYIIDLNLKVDQTKLASNQSIKVPEDTVKLKHPALTSGAANPVVPRTSIQKKKKATLGCPKFSTFAHRGGPTSPENSIPAVIGGLQGQHNGVEIDTQRLSDGNWVVHHDPMIGRSSYGESGFVNLLSSEQWKHVYLLDRDGNKSKVKAPLLKDLLLAFKKNAVTGQVINIEIKMIKNGQYSCNQLAALESMVHGILKPSQFLFTSTYLSALQCVRNVNHGVYLGLIIEPHKASLERVIHTSYGAEFRSIKSHLPQRLQTILKHKFEAKHKRNREWLSHKSYADLASLIGSNFGLHIDYRDMDKVAGKLSTVGGRWMVYELNDDAGMLKALQLRLTARKTLPDAIIIDSPRQDFCHL